MTVDIRDNLSLLSSLLVKSAQQSEVPSAVRSQEGDFANRLDRVLKSTNQADMPELSTQQALAESLSLQMLQTSLSLGDSSIESNQPLFNRQSPQFQTLVKAYASNLPENGTPDTQPNRVNQLQEQETVPASVTGNQGNQWLASIITTASNRYGVDEGLIKAVIKAESGFNPNAVSHAGAQGLMQLMPGTARSLGVNNSFDPEQNVMAGTRFLRDLLKRYNGNVDSALAAYNWGPGNVDRKPEQLPRETRDYLVRVKQFYNSYTA
jgi:soluble lytic murein transglycosylase-like protein